MSLSLTKNYATASPLTKAHLDTPLGEIETKFNTTGIAADELQSNAVTTAKILDANVTTAKIADLNVTTGKINDLAVTAGKIAADAVTTVKILDANVTTAKIADAAVTQAKRALLGQQVSSSCGDLSLTNTTTWTDVTNLSVSITTTGRPVFLGLITDNSDVSATFDNISSNNSNFFPASAAYLGLRFTRSGTALGTYVMQCNGSLIHMPCGAVWHVDVPSANTYTYKLQYAVSGAGTSVIRAMKLIAFEL